MLAVMGVLLLPGLFSRERARKCMYTQLCLFLHLLVYLCHSKRDVLIIIQHYSIHSSFSLLVCSIFF